MIDAFYYEAKFGVGRSRMSAKVMLTHDCVFLGRCARTLALARCP